MIDIISKQDRRHLTILEALDKHDFCTLKDLGSLTKASRKTIQDDFTLINDYISPISIATSNEGCTLISPDYISIDYIYSCVLTSSLEFSLIELVFFETYERLEDYADALFISLSTLKRMIRRMNVQMKKNGLEIKTGPIELVGDEELIRDIMVCFFVEKYISGNFPVKKVELTLIHELTNYFVSMYHDKIHLVNIERIRVSLLVSAIRIKNKHYLNLHNKLNVKDKITNISENIAFKASFKSVFKINLNETSLSQMFASIINTDFIYSYNDLIISTEQSSEKEVVFDHIQKLLNNLSSQFQIPLPHPEQLLIKLFNIVITSVREDYLIYNKNRLFLSNLLTDSPLAAEIIYASTKKIYFSQRPFKEYELEKFLYLLITHWPELAEKIQTDIPVYNVGVYIPNDPSHGKFITGTLNAHYKGKFIFQTILTRPLSKAEAYFNDYQFILTTLSNIESNGIRFLAIDTYPSTKDFHKLDSIYNHMIKETQ